MSALCDPLTYVSAPEMIEQRARALVGPILDALILPHVTYRLTNFSRSHFVVVFDFGVWGPGGFAMYYSDLDDPRLRDIVEQHLRRTVAAIAARDLLK